MMLVELLRIRWWMLWWSAVIAVIGIGLAVTVSHTVVNVNESQLNGIVIPAYAITGVAMFVAMIFATSAGLSLNREADTLALSWTKPISRTAVALRIMTVDVAAVAAAYVFAWIVASGVVGSARGTIRYDGDLPTMLVLSFGVAVMWYALTEAVTAAIPFRGIVGFMWPVALLLASLNGVSGTFALIVRTINVINPLAYMSSIAVRGGEAVVNSYWQAPPGILAACVWLLSCALAAVAIALWQRREA